MAEKEYIERGALMKKIFPYGDIVGSKSYSINAKAIQEVMQDVPAADVVEVVRCKDCRRFVQNEEAFVTYCKRELKNLYVKPNDFCSYGERKTI